MSKEIRFYRTDAGSSPVEEFIDSLTGKQAQKVVWVLSLIEELDTVPVRYFKKLVNTDDLWEVRIDSGSNTFRVIGFLDERHYVVLVHGFQKKSQKTPKHAIDLAQKRKKDYFRRITDE
jgi:phage-related protein